MLLLYIIASIVFVVIIVLASPIVLDICYSNHMERKKSVRLNWLYGLVDTELLTNNGAKRQRVKEKKQNIKSVSKKSKKRNSYVNSTKVFIAFARSDGLLKRLLQFIKELKRNIQVHVSRLNLAIGTGDPCDTGRLWGSIAPFYFTLQAVSGPKFQIYPIFDDHQIFDLNAQLRLRVVPLKVIRTTLRFFLSREFWVATRAGIKAKKGV